MLLNLAPSTSAWAATPDDALSQHPVVVAVLREEVLLPGRPNFWTVMLNGPTSAAEHPPCMSGF